GFYYLEKYKVAPDKLPAKLHWFKWEAYFTWISGFSLLIVANYLKADSMMIDPSVRALTPGQAVGISIGVLITGWLVYDVLCKGPLIKQPPSFSALGFGLAVGSAYFLTRTFGARPAYIHGGAMLGTIMAANVFFVISPAHKALGTAAEKGEELNPQL